ncbi:MAG: GNAT family N-acetyltransferase [Nitrososphaerales archaeon]
MENLFAERVGDYTVRRCTKEDLKNVISINLISLPEHYSDFFFEDILRSSPESFLVAEKDGSLVGYIMCRVEYGFSNYKRFSLTRKGHIVSLAILEPHRKRGLGEALVRRAVDGLKLKGCSEVYLEVRVSNTDAVRLYRRLAFDVLSTMEGYYRDNEAACLMGIQIT